MASQLPTSSASMNNQSGNISNSINGNGSAQTSVAPSGSTMSSASPLHQQQQFISPAFELMKKHIGGPHNYGPTSEQVAAQEERVQAEKAREQAAMEEDRATNEKEAETQRVKVMAEWNTRMEEVRKQEQDLLEAQSLPLRNYLMKHVMPTLTTALIDVCQVRPDDPIDYVAEYLFKHNPANA